MAYPAGPFLSLIIDTQKKNQNASTRHERDERQPGRRTSLTSQYREQTGAKQRKSAVPPRNRTTLGKSILQLQSAFQKGSCWSEQE
jgi:hypothetical protein